MISPRKRPFSGSIDRELIGVEGVQRFRHLDPNTLLILDPAEGPPASMATCNARLDYAGRKKKDRPRYARYITAKGDAFAVVLNGAVAIDVTASKKPP